MNECKIRVHFSGTDTTRNDRAAVCVDMVAQPEESLMSIVDRIPTMLVEIKVKAIEFLN